MIHSRGRAMGVVITACILGIVIGGVAVGLAARTGHANWIWRGRGNRPPSGYATQLARRLHVTLDVARRDSINVAYCRGVTAMDSLLQPIRPVRDSLFRSIQPQLDSAFQSIRGAVDARRAETRREIRALLTPAGQARYDSLNRAEDDQRRKARDQGGQPPGQGNPCTVTPGGPGPRGGFDRGPH